VLLFRKKVHQEVEVIIGYARLETFADSLDRPRQGVLNMRAPRKMVSRVASFQIW
jgi:hypothetical protein